MDNNSEYLRRIRVFIASPDDVPNERETFRKIIERVNRVKALSNGIYLEAVGWEDTLPGKGRPQEKINKDIIKCDIIIMLLWKRWGTPTGKYSSGFEEEFEISKKHGKDIWFYFREISDSKSDNNDNHIEKVSKFKNKLESDKEYVFKLYKDENDWTELFFENLCKWLDEPVVENTNPLNDDNFDQIITNTLSIQSRIYDEIRLPSIGSAQLSSYLWDVNNFDGFWYDLDLSISSESLEIGGLFSSLELEINNNNRIIYKSALVYQTTRQNKTLKIVENGKSSSNIFGLFENGQYQIVGWMGQPYIAVNGQANKLAQLIIEQGNATNEKKTLTIGETWDIGDGWALSAQSIDAKASPRQVWLVLSKNGVKKDDKVIAQGNSYVYIEKEFADEKDVPLFITYVDKIFAGATTDMIQLRYTWAIGTQITEPKVNDRLGNMEVVTADFSSITLKNKEDILLSPGQIVDIMDNLKFKVADDPNFLRFYPMISK